MDAPEDEVPVTSLPRPLARKVFYLLPLETQLVCTAVCRAWRQICSDPSLWDQLYFDDLGEEQRNAPRPVVERLLCAAALRARGQLTYADLRGWKASTLATMQLVAGSGFTLRTLILDTSAAERLIAADAKSA